MGGGLTSLTTNSELGLGAARDGGPEAQRRECKPQPQFWMDHRRCPKLIRPRSFQIEHFTRSELGVNPLACRPFAIGAVPAKRPWAASAVTVPPSAGGNGSACRRLSFDHGRGVMVGPRRCETRVGRGITSSCAGIVNTMCGKTLVPTTQYAEQSYNIARNDHAHLRCDTRATEQ